MTRSLRSGSARLSVAVAAALLMWQAASAPMARAVSPDIVISQVYGGGGNAGATLKNDFIELFNRGDTTVNLTGWSVQYASSTGNFGTTNITPLAGSLAPGQYYLIQQAQGAGGTTNLPAPDAAGTIAMSATAGKVALVATAAALTGTCPSGTVDLVGFGSAANCSETSATPTLSNTTAAIRVGAGCRETDNNGSDFVTGAPTPRNTASALTTCPPDLFVSGAANPSLVNPGASTLLTAIVTPGQSPTSTGIAIRADLTPIGGTANQSFFDDGEAAHGDVTAGDNIFSLVATVSAATGVKSIPVRATDAQGRLSLATIVLTVQDPAPVVISQVYGGGGNTSATFQNDYVELFNRSSASVDVSGWSVQYASSTGNSWARMTLIGSIEPGGYLLVQGASNAAVGAVNPAADVTGTINLAAADGKVALVKNTTLLTGSGCPFGETVVDFVGYGAANCAEGGRSASAGSSTRAATRVFAGCTDTNVNAADFRARTPAPRNSSSLANDCSAPPLISINQIQGTETVSPLAGETVTTSGIVTGVRFNNGFFIQTPDGAVDSDPGTSEGIFVFTGDAPPAAAARGNLIEVQGMVEEFVPSQDPHSPPVTEIGDGPVVRLISTGNPLPAAIEITAADTDPLGTIEQVERLEGMRVQVESLTAVAPTQGSINESSATSTSNGVFYGVITGIDRPFREPGVEVPDALPPGSPAGVPRFDGNPEKLRVDSDGQVGGVRLDVSTGAVITGLVGPLDYSFRTYTILPDPPPATPPGTSGGISAAVPVPQAAADEFTVAASNLERFFDDLPNSSAPVLTPGAFANRLSKASLMFRNVLRSPDIIGVEEVENLGTLQALASKINADTVAAGGTDPGYAAYLEEGNDIGGIDSGFLVKTSRVTVDAVTQEGKDTTYTFEGVAATLNDRPPLVLEATLARPDGQPYPVTVIVNHLRSLSAVDDPADGNRVRHKRQAQADFLASLIQARQSARPNERIISVGDYNAFQFSDGYVDSIGTIKGTPTPADEVVLASADLVNPDLINLVDAVPAVQRYSYSFDGNAQVLDHVLVTRNQVVSPLGLQYGRNNTDFAESFRNDPTRSERISDHDPVVAYFKLDGAPVAVAGPNQEVSASAATCQSLVTLDGTGASDPDGDPLTYAWSGSFGTATGASPIVTLSQGTHVITLTVDDGLGGVSTASVTVTVVDTTAPVITLGGANPLTHEAFTPFIDPGATALDACDGSVSVTATSTVNANVPGTYTIDYSAQDLAGNPAGLSRAVSVVDTRAPSVTSVSASPDIIWPANHKLVPVAISVLATDLGGTPSCRVTQVSNDETGSRDAIISAALHLLLRAERSGGGQGRVYTIEVTCTDAAGNTAKATTTVRVAHDQGH